MEYLSLFELLDGKHMAVCSNWLVKNILNLFWQAFHPVLTIIFLLLNAMIIVSINLL